jgi:5-methylcytosine-specific restriction endonuclease McrA
MPLFDKVVFSDSDKTLLANVSALAGQKWSSANEAIQKYRLRLLKLQRWRCVYCQSPIQNESGHRELDHILPKDKSPWDNDIKRVSNLYDDRRHTLGYENFTYEPKNLIVACKICNTNKGTFDSRRNRSRKTHKYPPHSRLIWLRPFDESYATHIKFDPSTWTYTRNSDEGDFVIWTCKLDDPSNLSDLCIARGQAIIARTDGFCHAVRALALSISTDTLSVKAAVLALMEDYPGLDENELKDLLIQQAESMKSIDMNIIEDATRTLIFVSAKVVP